MIIFLLNIIWVIFRAKKAHKNIWLWGLFAALIPILSASVLEYKLGEKGRSVLLMLIFIVIFFVNYTSGNIPFLKV